MTKTKDKYNILVIEDNPGDFALIEEYLQDEINSPHIQQAKNWKEATLILWEKETVWDVILLDLTLPDKSGKELITDISHHCSGCPVIVLTGYSDISFSVQSLALGISDYLLKDELSAASLFKSILYSIERNRSLATLEESEKRYSELFHLSPLPMWVYDTETLVFLDVNAAAIRNYGYSLEEFLGMTIREIRPPEDIPAMEKAVLFSKQQQLHFFQGTFRHKKKNGDIIYADVQSNIIQFKGIKAKLVLAADITERITYITAIEKQNTQLKEIAWIQSHVVRAPLARMMGLIDLLNNFSNSDAEKSQLLGYVLDSAHELDHIIRDISAKTEMVKMDIEKIESPGLYPG